MIDACMLYTHEGVSSAAIVGPDCSPTCRSAVMLGDNAAYTVVWSVFKIGFHLRLFGKISSSFILFGSICCTHAFLFHDCIFDMRRLIYTSLSIKSEEVVMMTLLSRENDRSPSGHLAHASFLCSVW